MTKAVLDAFARAIDEAEAPSGAAALVAALRLVVPFHSAVALVFRRSLEPVHMFDSFTDPQARLALRSYLETTYVLNPVYDAFLRGLPGGVFRMRDIAPDAYFDSDLFRSMAVRRSSDEELGYITPGWPEGLEEIVLALRLDGDAMGEIGLSRLKGQDGFSGLDVERLEDVMSLCTAIFRRVWRKAQPDPGNAARTRRDSFLDPLTSREREVALMILKGHSSESIALNLKLATATIKTHRINLYRKLGISSQAELFAQFVVSQQPDEG